MNRLPPNDLVYMDPPYQGVCISGDPRYLSGIDFDEFVHELRKLNERGIAFILSYDGRTGDKPCGRRVAAYRLGDLQNLRTTRLLGRRSFPCRLRDELYQQSLGRCAICGGSSPARYLQVDHRVPYEIAGEPRHELETKHFLLLCASCNRAKSWSCEHCAN